ncbi:MAG: lanthionine synthetase LanC family protein [Bryobacteraceae bacterium]
MRLIIVLALVFPLVKSYAVEKFSADERVRWKTYVDQIATTLTGKAVKRDQGISWVNVTQGGKNEESVDFYLGDSGICYFLMKAYAVTHESKHLDAANSCMAYILSQAKRDSAGMYLHDTQNGLFEGNAGPGYLFLYAYHVTKSKERLKTAEAIADRIIAKPDTGEKSSPDIIAGAAGTGLFLLKMYDVTKKSAYLDGAKKLGDFLVATAEPQAKGVKWKVRGTNVEYYFVGFSHGPAGIGYYLDRLYRATKVDKYKEYADKAMEHIEEIAIPEKNGVKWYHEELARKTRYSSQWCHGNPGMNPFFLDLYFRSKDKQYLDWAEKSTNYILDQGVNVRKNGSVCHGISGNTAAIYIMWRATQDPAYFKDVRDGIRQLEESAKKTGNEIYWEPPGHNVDYSYMTGLAGIGDFFALLASDGKLNMFGPLGYGDDM